MMTGVNERCRAIATFRHVSVRLMEIVARWTPTTPEMEAKIMFGRHIWLFAQMADALGKRAFELRKPRHFTISPSEAYDALIDEVGLMESTGNRVAALYEGISPGLMLRYSRYVAATDPILDEPSVSIIERIGLDLKRQCAEAAVLKAELHLHADVAADIAARERAIDSIVPDPQTV